MKNKAQLKTEADIRNEQWRKLSADEQLKTLDERLGFAAGAIRQRARLHAQKAKKS